MKVLELDVESMAYELIKPEAKFYEESETKKASVDDAVVMFVCIEEGDDTAAAEKAGSDAVEFAKRIGRKRIVIYPYAHLSNRLADPKSAMTMIDALHKLCAASGLEITRSPFGWNKKWTIEIKGHPLAEQLKSYGAEEPHKHYAKAKPVSLNSAIVRKSDFAGLADTDHRTIGERLDLFSMQEVSPGMIYWHYNGFVVFSELVKYIRERLVEYGYTEVSTPALANLALFQMSGHLDHYRENMFVIESETEKLGLKPMNCPSVMMIYKSRRWSYRDLPVRLSDFDKVYRNEVSGALSGLFRVREITQDDAHIFLAEEQIDAEMDSLIRLIKEFYSMFGLDYIANLSTMPDSHMGDEKLWERATGSLRKALERNKVRYQTKEKEGAFYGPKIDFDIYDSAKRAWQCATVQLDFQLPQRLGLSYTGEDGKEHTPVVIHRVIYGSLERFIGVMIEHLNGKMPVWLAPVQVQVVSISEETAEYAGSVYKELAKHRIRARLDDSDRTLPYKIREAQMQKIPYIVVLGKREEESKRITVRDREGKQKQNMQLGDFVKQLVADISERRFGLELK
jgi:threonyl-tRNA synthetase